MNKNVIKIIAEVFELEADNIDNNFSMKTYAKWDSVMHLVLIAVLEERFNKIFSPDSIANIKSIGDIEKTLNL